MKLERDESRDNADWPLSCSLCRKEVKPAGIVSADSVVLVIRAEVDRDWYFLAGLGKPEITSGEALCGDCAEILKHRPDWPGEASRDEVRDERQAIIDNQRPFEYDRTTVRIRREPNDWRIGTVALGRIEGFRWDSMTGGVQVATAREHLFAYAYCSDIEGDIAHSCQHGAGPHLIKVVVLRVDNPDVFDRLAGKIPTGGA